MTKTKLKTILRNHAMWLADSETGKCADFRFEDLSRIDLSYKDLRHANFEDVRLCGANLRGADLSFANFHQSNLRDTDLRGTKLLYTNLHEADLQRTNLVGANMDYSCLPLWCGSLGIRIDKRIAAQIAYHFLRMKTTNKEVQAVKRLPKLRALAKQFHRFEDCNGFADWGKDL